MKCRIASISLGVALWFAALNSVFAQGTAFTYQGLLNINGAAANGTFDLQFKLHPSIAVTNQVAGTITNTAVGITNGVFTTVIDFSYAFPQSPLYLEIGVRTNGSTGDFTILSPNQLITSVPYALQALNAANFTGPIQDSQLSANIPQLNDNPVFSSQVTFSNATGKFSGTFSGAVTGTFTGTTTGTNIGTFIGNGGAVTNLNVTNLVGVVQSNPNWQLTQSSPQLAVVANNYLTTNGSATTLILPTIGVSAGSTLRFAGSGQNGWILGQTAGQSILTGNLGLPAGQNWNSNAVVTSSTTWQCVASSSNGLNLIAAYGGGLGFIYFSHDGGVTWFKSDAPQLNWKGLASSADGLHMLAAPNGGQSGGFVFTSANGGSNWTGQTSGLANTSYSCAASSSDGINLVVASTGSGSVYRSSSGGSSWGSVITGHSFTGIASSADGTKLAACVSGASQIYVSKDSGATWNPYGPTTSWSAIASSADGDKLVATVSGGNIYTSGDGGITWTPRATSQSWTCVTSSATGVNLAAAYSTGFIYTSSDTGQTWIQRTNGISTLAKTWSAICSSVDGSRLLAAINGGPLYTSSAATTIGPTGYLTGVQYSNVELQYIGSGQWMVLSFAGSFSAF